MPRKLVPGLYEELVTADLARALAAMAGDEGDLAAERTPIDPATSHVVLARHLHRLLEWALRTFPEKTRIEQQVQLVDRILAIVEDQLTMYEDYAISPTELHWQSQNHAVHDREPGSRHVDPRGAGVTPVLFVRDTADDARGRTQPYLLLGPAEVASWHGERPINVVWRLATPMPADWFREARVVGG